MAALQFSDELMEDMKVHVAYIPSRHFSLRCMTMLQIWKQFLKYGTEFAFQYLSVHRLIPGAQLKSLLL